jgi:predicted nucleotidyltransferase
MVIKSVAISLGEATPSWYTPVTDESLQQITQRIIDAFQPEKVILFGSYAYGEPTIHSDVDLLVVTRRYPRKSVFERDRLVLHEVRSLPVPVEVLVRTPAELAYRLRIGDSFFREITRKGRVLYESSQSPRRMGTKSRNRLQKRTRSRTPA